MTILLKNFIYLTIIAGVLLIILGLVSGRLAGKIGYRWRKPVWILLLLLFLFPFSVLKINAFHKEDLNYQTVQGEQESGASKDISDDKSDDLLIQDITEDMEQTGDIKQTHDMQQTQELGAEDKRGLDIKNIWFEIDNFINKYSFWISAVWIAGMIISIRFYIIVERHTENKLTLFSEKPVEKRLSAIMEKVCKEMGISEKIHICYNSRISSPVFYNVWNPTIYIPKTLDLSDSQWEYVFSHELYHYKACDMIYKKFISVCVCILWFHPMVYYIRKKAYEDLEYVCDSKVTESMDKEQIAEYCKCILQMVPVQNGILMSFCNTKKRLQKRFDNCFNVKNKKRNVIATAAVCGGVMFFGITSMLLINEVLAKGGEDRNIEKKYMLDFGEKEKAEKKGNASEGGVEQEKDNIEKKDNISEGSVEQEKEKAENSETTELKLSQKVLHYDTGIQPETGKLEKLRDYWLGELGKEERETVEKLVLKIHARVEHKIVDEFIGYDCSPSSLSWNEFDDDPNDNVIHGYTAVEMIADMETVRNIVNKENFTEIANHIIEEFQILIETHDIELLYRMHQELHDLSYFAVNYPLPTLPVAPADWHGVYVYFGTLDDVL